KHWPAVRAPRCRHGAATALPARAASSAPTSRRRPTSGIDSGRVRSGHDGGRRGAGWQARRAARARSLYGRVAVVTGAFAGQTSYTFETAPGVRASTRDMMTRPGRCRTGSPCGEGVGAGSRDAGEGGVVVERSGRGQWDGGVARGGDVEVVWAGEVQH